MKLDRVDGMMSVLVIIWGSAFPAITILAEALDPYQMTWFRYAPFLLLYGAWFVLRGLGKARLVTARDWIVIGLVGFVGVVGYHFPLNWAMHGDASVAVSPALGAVLIATVPLWTLTLAIATRQEKAHPLALGGSLLAFAGVAVTVLLGRAEAGIEGLQRAAIVLIAPISWATYSTVSKPLLAKYGGTFTTGVTLGVGTLTLLPLAFSYGVEPLAALEARHWYALLFLSLLSTVAGYAIWNQALKRRSASSVAAYVYLQPVISTIVAFLLLGQGVTAWFVVGSLMVLAGVATVNTARLRAARQAAASQAA